MRTYHDVETTGLQPFLNIRNFLGCPQTAYIIYIAREILQTVPECIVMLQSKNSSRNKHGHLLAVGDCLECRTYRHFSLTEAYVSADKSVHRTIILHIPLDGLDRLFLIRCILIHKGRLKFLLKICIRRECKSLGSFTLSIELNQILGDILDL